MDIHTWTAQLLTHLANNVKSMYQLWIKIFFSKKKKKKKKTVDKISHNVSYCTVA